MVQRGGTDLERAIRGALGLLPAEGLGRVVVLVSDGEGLDGDPEAAVAAAREAGVGMVALVAGTTSGGPIPVPDGDGGIHYLTRASGQPVMTRADPLGLDELLATVGGEVLSLERRGIGSRLLAAVARLRAREVTTRGTAQPVERFPVFLGAAASLLVGGFLTWPWRRCVAAAALLALLPLTTVAADGDVGPAQGRQPSATAEGVAWWQRLLPGAGRRCAARGLAAWQRADFEGAVAEFRAALVLDAEDPDRLFDLGTALAAADSFEAAVPLLEAAHRRGVGAAAYNLGTAALLRGEAELAVTWLRTAVLQDATDGDAKRNYELALRLAAGAGREAAVADAQVAAGEGSAAAAGGAAGSRPPSEIASTVFAALERAESEARRQMLHELPEQVAPAGRTW
jgi:hypothetical protein